MKTTKTKWNKLFLAGMAATMLIFGLVLAGCDTGNIDPNPTGPRGTPRYETVPYSKSGAKSVSRATDNWVIDNQLVWSAYDDEQYYYVFLLGHVTMVPLAYRQAVLYNGTTPITIGYSKTDGSENSVMNSITTANENSTTQSTSYNWGVEAEVGVTFASIVKTRLQVSGGGEYGWDTTNTRSYSDTKETVNTKTSSETDDISVTIGGNGESEGLYRYSLFGTTDVYAVVVADHSKKVKEKYLAYCARPTTFWGIDYEPDIGGNFGKTAPGALFEMSQSILTQLPTPTSNDVQPLPGNVTADPVAGPVGILVGTNTYEAKVTVTLMSETENAVIYYTTDGNTPTTGSAVYTKPLEFTTNTTLKAIATAAGKGNSSILSKTYTITEQPLQVVWGFDNDPISLNVELGANR
ncbi:hypothetical protein FACS1894164_19540 [Spirochaetia bacterium]|nr:hypothetical protein FACS1894164_19540 [Spirochaetia bacterium]